MSSISVSSLLDVVTMSLRATNLSITLERLPEWFQSHDRAQSLLRVGAWAGAYYAVHRATYALSLIAAPKDKRAPGGVDLDGPVPRYAGCSLRKVAAARAASFVHAVGSFAWNARLMRRHWGVLRDVAQRRPVVRLLGRALPLLAYDASNELPGAREAFCCSLGYFVQELAHVLGNEPDPVFVAHHVAYITATLPIVCSPRGWAMVSLATLLAEVTNPLQLSWELARAFGCEQVYDALSPPFTFGFAVCRGVLMPLAMGDIAVWVSSAAPMIRARRRPCASPTASSSSASAPRACGSRSSSRGFRPFWPEAARSLTGPGQEHTHDLAAEQLHI